MAIRNSSKVTVTLERTIVEMLRAQKRGLETWDDLMLRLGRRRARVEIECISCGDVIETTDEEMSPAEHARAHGWTKLYTNEGGGYTDMPIGYICKRCRGFEWRQKEGGEL